MTGQVLIAMVVIGGAGVLAVGWCVWDAVRDGLAHGKTRLVGER